MALTFRGSPTIESHFKFNLNGAVEFQIFQNQDLWMKFGYPNRIFDKKPIQTLLFRYRYLKLANTKGYNFEEHS